MKAVICSLLVSSAYAYPWVARMPGVDSSMLEGRRSTRSIVRRQQAAEGAGSAANCPFNTNHVPAAPVTDQYPYNGAKNGLPGNRRGNYIVPDPNDSAHQFVAPGANDIRGPCPGLNAAANHNFLSHDGVVTFDELVDAQQNVYNVDYDLALLLATLGLTTTDGDIATEKLSIGCDATTRTSVNPTLTGSEPGLDGHNKFEADASLTRNDFFTHNGDDFSFNSTLFGMMAKTCNNYFDINGLSLYRSQRWQQSQADNPNFFYGPLSLLEYGAASFLYELMPSGTNNQPDLATVSSFFGAHQQSDGSFTFGHDERIPANWTTRATPYDNNAVTIQIVEMYLKNPVLFGGNTADGSFDTLNFGAIQNGKISPGISAHDTSCLLYQLVSGPVPSSLNGIVTPSVDALQFVATKLGPQFNNLGCAIALT